MDRLWSWDSTLTPLKLVCLEMRLTSSRRWSISAWMDFRSDELLVPLAACTVSLRMRCRLALIWSSAPSVVCATEMPSLALRLAWLRPLTCAVMRLAMAWPAASSAAELMRRPEDRRFMAVCSEFCERFRFRWATRAVMLVLITDMLGSLVWFGKAARRPSFKADGPVISRTGPPGTHERFRPSGKN